MYVSGLSCKDVQEIVEVVSWQYYTGNIVMRNAQEVSPKACRFTLWAIDAHGSGARTSASGRYAHAASWYAYRDVIRALYAHGARTVRTSLATYHSADEFEATHSLTALRNVGSQLCPVTMLELTVG